MMRGLMLLVLSALFAGCGATPNASATQTRTSEIVELTVAARTLPTANAAIPPTPIPVPLSPTPPALPPSSPTTVPPSPSGNGTGYAEPVRLYAGSWVAFAPALRVRFFAPPSLIEAPEFNNDHRYSLGSPSNVYDFEALDIYRFVGIRGGDFAKTWDAEMDQFRKSPNVTALTVTSNPRPQQIGTNQGNLGQFHYFQKDNDQKISGTIWVGQVGGDEVVIIYRGSPEREPSLDQEFAQVIATIDFNAR